MKKIIFLAIACASFAISNAQESINAPKSNAYTSETSTTIAFDKAEHDFGVISESGGVAAYEFTFKNTGEIPLVITKVSTSCGCTAPDWSKEPIAPGEQGFIKVTFNPKGRSGDFTKSLTVFTNGNPSALKLNIKGHIGPND